MCRDLSLEVRAQRPIAHDDDSQLGSSFGHGSGRRNELGQALARLQAPDAADDAVARPEAPAGSDAVSRLDVNGGWHDGVANDVNGRRIDAIDRDEVVRGGLGVRHEGIGATHCEGCHEPAGGRSRPGNIRERSSTGHEHWHAGEGLGKADERQSRNQPRVDEIHVPRQADVRPDGPRQRQGTTDAESPARRGLKPEDVHRHAEGLGLVCQWPALGQQDKAELDVVTRERPGQDQHLALRAAAAQAGADQCHAQWGSGSRASSPSGQLGAPRWSAAVKTRPRQRAEHLRAGPTPRPRQGQP